MPDARRQFQVLYRDFLVRLIDLEVLAAQGDPQKLFTQFAALLAAFSFVAAVYIVPQYPLSKLPPDRLALAATGDQQFLIATTMAVAGMFAVMAWGGVFPDRRDGLILGTLPIRPRTILFARVAATATGLGVSVVAVNLFTGLSYPLVTPPGTGIVGALRALAAYWMTTAAAGIFVFSALLAVQGLAGRLLPYRLSLRASSFLQLGAFFTILGVYFLTPGSSMIPVTAPESWQVIAWFPSYWFLGLFQELNGSIHPVFGWLARRAYWALIVALALVVVTHAFAYRGGLRKIIEQPDIAPGSARRPLARLGHAVAARLARKPLERAMLLFTARTLARSRQHRLILAVYCGIGLAIALAYCRDLVHGGSSLHDSLRRYITATRWNEPNFPLMVAGFVLLFFTVIGTRAIFSLPIALKANWVFRLTTVHGPQAYFAAIRGALYALAAWPVVASAAIFYLAIWPAIPALAHVAVLALVAVILVERSLREFRKIPFTCSYLPGKSDLTRKLGVWGILFLFLSDVGTGIEFYALQTRPRYFVLTAILLTVAVRARRRWRESAGTRGRRIQFEDFTSADVAPLDLRRDGEWGAERYIDAVEEEPERPLGSRIGRVLAKAAAVTVVLLAAGAGWEALEGRRECLGSARVGRSVDIGGRSLNIHCSGSTGPAVILVAGGGGEGTTGWASIQRELSRYTRVCSYDRAGAGWSDPAPYPRDSIASARDLHQLLRASGIDPSYVLAGASLGGLIVRVYHGLFPNDVAGMVLVDSSHLDERESIPPAGELRPPDAFYRARSGLAWFLWRTGVLRFFFGEGPRGLAEFAKVPFQDSLRQARAAAPMRNRPLIVLTAGLPNRVAQNPVEARQNLARQKRWIEAQAQLAAFSNLGRQVVVGNSRHCIQCDAPGAIVDAVREVAGEVRD